MKILLYQDKTLNLNLKGLCEGLNRITSDDFYLEIGQTPLTLKPPIRYPISHLAAAKIVAKETKDADLVLIVTTTPYENNYFYEQQAKVTILSFYAWAQLTSLPMENGVVFFLASILRHNLPLPEAHDLTIGCLNDFRWDKTAVDLGMRSAGLCSSCQGYLHEQKLDRAALTSLRAIEAMLEPLGSASRATENVLDYLMLEVTPSRGQSSADRFHVFLCHNSKDKPAVRKIARALEARKIRPWLDEEQLRPGFAWQAALEEQISQIDSVAVFVGSSGMGPWHEMEVRAFLSEFVQRKCPVIPTILSEAKSVPELPIFLRQMVWVDFREDAERALDRLIWGITGKRPARKHV